MYSKIIDIHAHFNHGSPYECPTDIHYVISNRELDFLKKAYDDIGICAAGICTYASVMCSDCAYEENHYLNNLVKKTDWMYQWVVIDPRVPKTYVQAEMLLQEKKTLGIKIHPDCHGYNIEEYAEELFSFAAKHQTFLLMHPQKIEKMKTWADRYPKMRLIIAHLGSVDHINAVAEAKYGNIYVDTSGGASNLNNIVECAVEHVGSEKIFFGTDNYSCAFQVGRIALSSIPAKDKENILYKNAQRHFGI